MDDRPSPWLRRGLPLTALVVGLAVLGLLLHSLRTRLPGSPEECFAEFQRLAIAGDWGTLWDIRAEEGRRDYVKNIDLERNALLRNPHPSNDSYFLKKNVTREQFLSMGYRELWKAQMSNPEYRRWMVDARIVKVIQLPGVANDRAIHWEGTDGRQFRLHVRETPQGWTWVRQFPYTRPETVRGE